MQDNIGAPVAWQVQLYTWAVSWECVLKANELLYIFQTSGVNQNWHSLHVYRVRWYLVWFSLGYCCLVGVGSFGLKMYPVIGGLIFCMNILYPLFYFFLPPYFLLSFFSLSC
ncbi:unnamed protein product [Ilex paraguariensis]|uniref:Uncharacterized protein n=1 Tax=Ilex paraguariensis TaxID=185542 RepID=A0ABC8QKY3_9AQUA